METAVQKKLGAGLLGGEGFIMQKFSGQGDLFLEIDGSVIEYNLAAGQVMIVDTGSLALLNRRTTQYKVKTCIWTQNSISLDT